MNHEDELVAWLQTLDPGTGLDRPGDDAAVLGRGRTARALTVDQQIAGVHVPSDLDPGVWARRLLAVNLSDLAAMGARPEAALLALAVPEEFPHRAFLRATVAACRSAGARLAGGDVARSSTAVTSMTLLGRRPPKGRWLRRNTGRPGDRLWVGGELGISALGQRLVARGARQKGRRVELPDLGPASSAVTRAAKHAVRRHLAPTPQLALGEWLGRRRAAVIDVSDGLTRDLHRLCRASGVGATISLDAVTKTRTSETLARAEGVSFLSLVLGGGEDYVLLFATGPRTTPPAHFGARPIGWLTAERGLWSETDGRRSPLEAEGWDHLA